MPTPAVAAPLRCIKAVSSSRMDNASFRTMSLFNQGAMEGAVALVLHQGSLTFQDGQRLFKDNVITH